MSSTTRSYSSRPLLAFVAVMLVVNTAIQVASLTPAEAHAQNRTQPSTTNPPTFPNNAEVQRRQADALADINAKLARIEAKLEKGLSVKVTEMPEMKFPTTTTDASGGR
jgi:hypothetical protein